MRREQQDESRQGESANAHRSRHLSPPREPVRGRRASRSGRADRAPGACRSESSGGVLLDRFAAGLEVYQLASLRRVVSVLDFDTTRSTQPSPSKSPAASVEKTPEP